MSSKNNRVQTVDNFFTKKLDKHKHLYGILGSLLKDKTNSFKKTREEKRNMRSFVISDRQQFKRIVVTAMLSVAAIVPSLAPALASADQVASRSIALSSSSKAATNVTYQVNFTSVGSAGAFVVDFCSDSPIIGQTCTAPTGFSASSAASTTSGFTDVSALDANTIVVTGTIGAATAISVDVTGITNPTNAGPLYARIVTYDTDVHADAYQSDNLGTGNVDDGGVAISITDSVGVSAAVLETMTFCVSGASGGTNPITAGCTGTLVAPTLTLGETVGSTKALTSSAVSTGDIYTQISTNAAGGAVVSLKSGVPCGGMKRVGAAVCDIAPALQTDIAAGQAKFGVVANADSATDTALSANGTFQIVPASGYDGSAYALNYVSGDATGVTSVYGDPILNTNGTQPSNRNMKLTFGASITNNTPAGLYSADLSLVATGTF